MWLPWLSWPDDHVYLSLCLVIYFSYYLVDAFAKSRLGQVGPQGMVDWGSFVVPKDGHANGINSLQGTGSRGLSMARTLGSEEADQV